MSPSVRVIGKYLDQPILVEKLRRAVPFGLCGFAAAYTIDKTVEAQPQKKKDSFIRTGVVLGATVAVAGGVLGGVAADKVTDADWRKRLPDKIKEGSYQYLANIFLCNVGAGAALAILEKNKIQSRLARGLGMVGGIILTGVIGGSKIANYIGDKIINPFCGSKGSKKDERTPELIDIGLHTDDIATVSLLSGLKWIEPALPVLYTVSGYRAGIGYRNHKERV